ncbi:MAG: hypothetical protein ACYTG7_14405 [Planctomycetota bacterium]|jgi:hypothetical protein
MYARTQEDLGAKSGISLPCRFLFLLLILSGVLACASSTSVKFRRFEVGPVPPEAVLQAGVETVKSFYTHVHGGVTLFIDEENLNFETGYVRKHTELDEESPDKPVEFVTEQPKRQKFYFKVIQEEDTVYVELLATYEIMYIQNAEDVKTADDIWKLVRQDETMEDLMYEKLLERLMEQKLLE